MVLGETLTDADGVTHPMANLLDLRTSFARRKLSLGYRTLDCAAAAGPWQGRLSAHEFHYATTERAEGTPLFRARDTEGRDLGPMGLRRGHVSGSFAHVIDEASIAAADGDDHLS